MYVTLKLDDNGWRVHSISDRNEEIVTNQKYVVMPWKMVTRCGANMTLKWAVEETKACKENRRSFSKFEAEHRDEMSEILGLIDCIDKGYVEESFLRFTTLVPSDTLKINSFSKGIALVAQLIEVITNSIISKRSLKHIRVEILMRFNMLKRWRPSQINHWMSSS